MELRFVLVKFHKFSKNKLFLLLVFQEEESHQAFGLELSKVIDFEFLRLYDTIFEHKVVHFGIKNTVVIVWRQQFILFLKNL